MCQCFNLAFPMTPQLNRPLEARGLLWQAIHLVWRGS
jgi:hypothetical protein